jgi:hypothetical protein
MCETCRDTKRVRVWVHHKRIQGKLISAEISEAEYHSIARNCRKRLGDGEYLWFGAKPCEACSPKQTSLFDIGEKAKAYCD